MEYLHGCSHDIYQLTYTTEQDRARRRRPRAGPRFGGTYLTLPAYLGYTEWGPESEVSDTAF